MSLEKVKDHLKKYNKDQDIIILSRSSATVNEAAVALNCKTAHIAKTLSFLIGEEPILIVMAGDSSVDNKKYKDYFHCKAKMIPVDNLEELIGHEKGGVCPFGINDGIKVYLDISLKRFAFVYPACGSSNSAIKLSISELEKYSNYQEWIDISKVNEKIGE